MARNRRSSMSTIDNTGENQMSEMADVFTELDDEGLAEALAGARSRGVYGGNFLTFLRSGRRGVEVNLTEGVHAGKKPQSVKTGYESARTAIIEGKNKDASEDEVNQARQTKVLNRNERVFLLRQDA